MSNTIHRRDWLGTAAVGVGATAGPASGWLRALAEDAPKKPVNFEKEKVLLFFWDWQGGDKLEPVADKPGEFTYSSTGVGKGGIGIKIFVFRRMPRSK